MEVKKASREEWSQPSSSHVKGFSNVPCCNCDERCLLRRANTQLNLGRLLSAHSIRMTRQITILHLERWLDENVAAEIETSKIEFERQFVMEV
ncbi:hypothetical protein MtrunA17_Chr4g0037901 [Medicago truncatula]|uniref:Uncharacterized protein n=1 Tax=Medicago truncatula TaxID=3880 RepID=A0A072UXH2_MEDTR|nr:hypothetical protein MTR_4g074465 [Medicago truncatula]RHN61554.1 hypothetical protein MtrunA17_Chr4g0037901 [Medicago truncatula]